MELLDIIFVFLPIVLVIFIRYIGSPISREEIVQAQKELDEIAEFNKKHFGTKVSYDAEKELLFGRFAVKGIIMMMMGFFLAVVTFYLFKTEHLENYLFSLTISSIFLMTYGLAFASRQRFLPLIILCVFFGMILFVIYYFNLNGLEKDFQFMKIVSAIFFLFFVFLLIKPRIEKIKE
ncbi:MAG TPA: hypothetical protein PK142_01325 [bacterium]|nr:hypothetical protein [bacterium]